MATTHDGGLIAELSRQAQAELPASDPGAIHRDRDII
jgi:hypothetical protein